MDTEIYELFDDEVFGRLLAEARRHPDRAERERREALLTDLQSRIFEQLTDYDSAVWDYERRAGLQRFLKVGVLAIPMGKAVAAKCWDERFGKLVTRAQKSRVKHYSDQYRWHVFSFGLLPCKSGDEARRAFDQTPKHTLWVFFQYGGQAFRLEQCRRLTAKDLDDLHQFADMDWSDVYLFDPKGSWTYVLTHESDLGPYFFG